jgi:hypothetical protein
MGCLSALSDSSQASASRLLEKNWTEWPAPWAMVPKMASSVSKGEVSIAIL